MSSTSATQPEPPSQPDLTLAYESFKHYSALGLFFGAPIIIALPPRKLDFYTFLLGSGFMLSANQLYKERRLRQLGSPFFGGAQAIIASATADKAGGGDDDAAKTRYEIVQEQLRREKEDRNHRRFLETRSEAGEVAVAAEGDGEARGGRPGLQGQLQKVWMGGEKAGWKERRLAEEQEKISKGEGYGGMIMDQIWEVWNWGKETAEEDDQDEKDESADVETGVRGR